MEVLSWVKKFDRWVGSGSGVDCGGAWTDDA